MNKKSIISLIKELKTFLKEKRKLSYEDPSINPVSSLAHLLSRKFVNDEIDFPKINSIIEHLSQELILQRASNLNKNNRFNIKKTIHMEAEWDTKDPIGEIIWLEKLYNKFGFPNGGHLHNRTNRLRKS